MNSVVQEKSYKLSLKILSIYKILTKDKKEFIISKQLIRAGTSIGANVEEALGGQSPRDFQSKMAIAYKEARETGYWLRLLRDSAIISLGQFNQLNDLLQEILKMLGKIQQTMKAKTY